MVKALPHSSLLVSWPKGAAEENVVVQVPDSCAAGASIKQKIIGFAVSVEIESDHRRRRSGNCYSNTNPYLMGAAVVKQQVGIAIYIEIGLTQRDDADLDRGRDRVLPQWILVVAL